MNTTRQYYQTKLLEKPIDLLVDLQEYIKTLPPLNLEESLSKDIDNVVMPWLVEVAVEICPDLLVDDKQILYYQLKCSRNLIQKYIQMFGIELEDLQTLAISAFALSHKTINLEDTYGCRQEGHGEDSLYSYFEYVSYSTKEKMIYYEKQLLNMTNYIPCGKLKEFKSYFPSLDNFQNRIE